MQELQRKIQQLFDKPKVIQTIVPAGFEKQCDCTFEIPNFSLGKVDIKEHPVTHRREFTFFPVSRFYCPVCGEEFIKI